jgi:hypothetical protein
MDKFQYLTTVIALLGSRNSEAITQQRSYRDDYIGKDNFY